MKRSENKYPYVHLHGVGKTLNQARFTEDVIKGHLKSMGCSYPWIEDNDFPWVIDDEEFFRFLERRKLYMEQAWLAVFRELLHTLYMT
jgi:hypothetical protein